MDSLSRLSLAILIFGLVLITLSNEIGGSIGRLVGAVCIAAGAAGLYFRQRSWYCAECGKHLGRGSKPGRCPRCGSDTVVKFEPEENRR